MEHSKQFLLCTIYDVGAGEHGPVFLAPTLTVAWRNVDSALKEVPQKILSQYYLSVHGKFDTMAINGGLVKAEFSQYYSCYDKTYITSNQLKEVVENIRSEFIEYRG